MSFPAHGVLIDVTADKLVLHRTLLATSLGAPATQDIPLDSIDTVRVNEPTATGFGALDLGAAGSIAFARTKTRRPSPAPSPPASAARPPPPPPPSRGSISPPWM